MSQDTLSRTPDATPDVPAPAFDAAVEEMLGMTELVTSRVESENAQRLRDRESSNAPFVVLCVDDEPNILNALRRLLRSGGYKVLTANSGQEALEVLGRDRVDLVISDMRMPGMTGAEFLAEVFAQHPEVLRILLTGYADMSSTVSAINSGRILRYESKPWDDHELLAAVADCLKIKALQRDKERLEALTLRQNEELRELNAGLEEKVAERTEEVSSAHERLKANFVTSIKVFSNLIDLRGGILSGHARRVAEVAVKIAGALQLPKADVQDVMLASLLHDIGKIGFKDELLQKPTSKMDMNETKLYRQHTIAGQQTLMALDNMQGVARIIRAHHELWDGTGFPDNLAGDRIPLAARIIAVADDFDDLQSGTMIPAKVARDEAVKLIAKGSGKRYCPEVVMAFERVMWGASAGADEKMIEARDVREGMVLSRDLFNGDGVMLLSTGTPIAGRFVKELPEYTNSDGSHLSLWIRTEPPKENHA